MFCELANWEVVDVLILASYGRMFVSNQTSYPSDEQLASETGVRILDVTPSSETLCKHGEVTILFPTKCIVHARVYLTEFIASMEPHIIYARYE